MGTMPGWPEAPEQPRFVLEPRFQLRGGDAGVDHFQRHFPLQTRVLGEIHDAHAAAADLLEDVIALAQHSRNPQCLLQAIELQARERAHLGRTPKMR